MCGSVNTAGIIRVGETAGRELDDRGWRMAAPGFVLEGAGMPSTTLYDITGNRALDTTVCRMFKIRSARASH